jgi:hypothetical protein
MTEAVGPSDHREQPIGDPQAFTMDEVELGLVGETVVPREPAARDGRRWGWGLGGQTARRLRPLARRRLSTSRPPFVAMRARKPWVLLRWRLLG